MKVIGEEHWSWMLFEAPDALYLSVLCGGVAMYTVDLKLALDERAKIEAEGMPAAAAIAQVIQGSPSRFTDRHIRDFSEMEGVESATKAWRAGRQSVDA